MCSDTIRQTIHRSLNKKTPQDRFFEESSFIQWFNEDVRKAGIKIITFHGLRHSHASYLLSNPILSEQLVADRLGHTIKTLRETYSHVYKKHRKILDDYITDL